MFRSLLLLIFLLGSADLKRKKNEKCRQCEFNEKELTGETIQYWPVVCMDVCGKIVFTEKSHLSQYQVSMYLDIFTNLIGSVQFVNTNFTDLSVLSKVTSIECEGDPNGVTIQNNSKLTNATLIKNWLPLESNCVFNVFNNPKLDASGLCGIQDSSYNVEMNIHGNLKNCGCKNIRIDSNSLQNYPNCTSITGSNNGGLKITGALNSSLSKLKSLSTLKSVNGNVDVYGTDLEDLSFLSSLESISADSYQPWQIWSVRDNKNMKRLGLDKLKILNATTGMFTINMTNLHPDFCITTSEMQLFMESEVLLSGEFKAKICNETTRKDGQKVCRFDGMSSLESDCIHVLGDVVVDSEDGVEKLTAVQYIYGSLTVRNTSLVDLSFLKALRKVGNLEREGPPVIQFIDNKLLGDVTMMSIKYPFSISNPGVVVFQNNAPGLFKSSEDCKSYESKTEFDVRYNGVTCASFNERKDTFEAPVAAPISESTTTVSSPSVTVTSETTTQKADCRIPMHTVILFTVISSVYV